MLFKDRGFKCLLAATVLFGMTEPAAAVSTTVVINEFRFRGSNGGSDEFIEIRNISTSPVRISLWKIRGSNGAGTNSLRATVPSGFFLQPGCHFLFVNNAASGYNDAVPGNQVYGTGMTDDGGIALADSAGVIIDQVGLSAGSAYQEGTPLSSLGTTNVDRSYTRSHAGVDTDNNLADFVAIEPSQPMNLASSCITIPVELSKFTIE